MEITEITEHRERLYRLQMIKNTPELQNEINQINLKLLRMTGRGFIVKSMEATT